MLFGVYIVTCVCSLWFQPGPMQGLSLECRNVPIILKKYYFPKLTKPDCTFKSEIGRHIGGHFKFEAEMED